MIEIIGRFGLAGWFGGSSTLTGCCVFALTFTAAAGVARAACVFTEENRRKTSCHPSTLPAAAESTCAITSRSSRILLFSGESPSQISAPKSSGLSSPVGLTVRAETTSTTSMPSRRWRGATSERCVDTAERNAGERERVTRSGWRRGRETTRARSRIVRSAGQRISRALDGRKV